ncbi:TPA: hypothetical protein JIU02_01025 [Acinetobacter baumannii]|nr:hypothetical protein [Acinetobacter baumannii]HAV3089636.1 hypothetical protein [Acinetobacter baumannii]HAV4623764.1 hypothetical protein [Acinetobacter baumannii]HAV4639053.1 hypothetical protein [Acinetobacter baumannii]HAV4650170.1 hypothetical protein [Acinetobacter baumannii]
MTDLNKEREAFLGFLRTKGVVKVGWNSLGVLTNLVREAGCTLSYNDIELMQEVWMEKAKAQAVPEGYCLVPKEIPDSVVSCLENSGFHWGDGTRDHYTPIYSLMVEVASESGAEG